MAAIKAVSFTTFRVDQPIGSYYVGRALVRDLLAICKFDFRRMQYKSGYQEFLGLQRKVDEKRARAISQYAMTMDACFPTAIIIAVPERCVTVTEECAGEILRLDIGPYIDELQPELNINLEEVATIIDGQHRLKGLEGSLAIDMMLPVSIFVGADDATEASIFSVVNLTQTKVNRSLTYDLFSLARTRSPEKTCHEVVVALDQMENSPFRGRIKRLGVATDGRFGETLAQATMVQGLLPYITSDALADRDRGKRFGFWEPISGKEAKRRIFYEFFRNNKDEDILNVMLNYFSAVANRWPNAWKRTGQGNIINRTNGYNAFMRFLRPAYLHFSTAPEVVSQADFALLFERVSLTDNDFNAQVFVPGSSGSSLLYERLVTDTGVR